MRPQGTAVLAVDNGAAGGAGVALVGGDQFKGMAEQFNMPFSRDTRALVYQRAKMVLDKRPFGTQEDVYHGNSR